MTFKKARLLNALLLIAVLPMTACTSVKKELGVGRNSPDEFMVVKRAPLTLPPDYTLRPPGSPTEAQPTEHTTTDTAKAILLGKSEETAVTGAAEKTLLDKAGATAANPDIRKLIDEENGYISLKNRSVADKIIFWNDQVSPRDNAPVSVVDPKAETARLKQNKAEGKLVNEGTVPVIEQKKGTIDKLF